MMADALTNLAEAIKAAAAAPIHLTAAFLTKGLNNASVAVPEGLDTALAKAFGTPDGSGLSVTVNAENVGRVADDSFTVSAVSLSLSGHDLDAAASLTFGLDGSTLSVSIDTAAKDWAWHWLSPAAGAWPFLAFTVTDARLTYATSGASASAVQQFKAMLAPPDKFKPVVDVIEGLGIPSTALPLIGTMDFSGVDGKAVLLPVMDLSAPFPGVDSGLKLGYFEIDTPAFGLSVEPADEPAKDDDGEEYANQQSLVFFSVQLSLKPATGAPVSYQLRASVDPRLDDKMFTFMLAPPGDEAPLFTPATAIELVDNSGSFFQGTPAQLQQFLGGIGLRGMAVDGQIGPPPKLTSVGLGIGADPNVISESHPWVLLGDPSNQNLVFQITDFDLNWRVDFSDKTQFAYLITTEFQILPDIFKGTPPHPDGTFEVEINSNYQILARFDGQASMSDIFKAVADIDLSNTFDITVSNIQVSIDVPAKRYSFDAGIEVDIGFGPDGSDPIFSLTDGELSLVAWTPRANGGAPAKTVYAGSFAGQINVGPLHVATSVAYENPTVDGGTGDANWKLSASLAQPIDIGVVVKQYFDSGFEFPDFLSVDSTIKALGFDATIPAAKTGAMSYNMSASFAWDIALGALSISSPKTDLAIAYDGKKPSGSQYSGSVSTIADFSFLRSDVELTFAFQKDDAGLWDNTLAITWEGLTATYKTKDETVVFTLKNWSLGSLIEHLVQSLGDPYFTLQSPWDLLNKIPLDGLSVTLHLNATGKEPKITAAYTLSSPIDLGFIKINGLSFARKPVDGKEKISLSLEASIPGPLRAIIDSGSPEDKKAWDNLLGQNKGDPGGQSVDDLPSVPGRGNAYFNMPLLVLGQRVGIAGYQDFKDTKAAIDALSGKDTPDTKGKDNPVSPVASKDSPAGTPYYEAKNNWLIAGHLQLLKAGKDWTIDVMIVFADPNLYGLRLKLAGEKAKALGKFEIDILYKRITDDIGLYQIEFTFPDSIRNLNFGTVSVVLPQLGIKIYTNGDFLIDVGFPYNMDFQLSFSISTIVMVGPVPVPLTGAGGFYFGKLSAATATQVPATTQGTFDPVVAFGFGLQLGIGYNFIKGPLKAGFAITVFGIVEGVIATWHPYRITDAANNTAVQDNYYFKISGTVGIIGLLYGEVNFAIISASLQVKLTLSVALTYESYRPIPIMVRATVDVSLRVKIDLGIFSITISLSFHADVSTQFLVHAGNEIAPWDDDATLAGPRMPAMLLAEPQARDSLEAEILPAPKAVMRAAAKPALSMMAVPQFTVMTDEGVTDPAAAQGAFVFLLAIDAPDATAETPGTGSSFETLLEDFLPWLIDAMQGQIDDIVDLSARATASVTEDELNRWINQLADLASPPISDADYLTFLSSFDVDIVIPSKNTPEATKQKFQAGSALFPMFDGLSFEAAPSTGDAKTVEFQSYVTAGETYRSNVAELFEQLAAKVGESRNGAAPKAKLDESEISMAAFVFIDAFNLIGRQLLQAGLNAMRDFAYPLDQGNSFKDIRSFLLAHRDIQNPQDEADAVADLIQANLTTTLATGITLYLPGLMRVVQSNDTLDGIAKAYAPAKGADAKTLILANPDTKSLIPGVQITAGGATATTGPGATFSTLAKGLGLSLEDLADAIGQEPGLLLPSAVLTVPVLGYTTVAGDTLAAIADQYALAPEDLFAPGQDHNQAQAPLFDAPTPDTTVPVPGLSRLTVADIWAALTGTEQISQIAGMLTRFLIYGLRLPAGAAVGGPTQSADFLYPPNQSAYGLYQLLGQQVPVPDWAAGATYHMTLSRSDLAHGVDLSFITFDGQAGTTAPPLDLTEAYERLSYVVTYARKGGFAPVPSFEALSPSTRTPKNFTIRSFSHWAAAGVADVAALCGAGGTGHPDPIIWSLPNALTQAVGQRQAALSKRFTSTDPETREELQKRMVGFLPVFEPTLTANDPATGAAKQRPIECYAWATRVDIEIRKLPPSPNPAGNPGLSGVTYEVLGPSPEEALLLERLLTAMDSLGDAVISDVFLLYPDGSSGTTRLASPAKKDFIAYLTQTNLSTETNPAVSPLLAMAESAVPQVRGIANPNADVVKLLWELSTVRSGGYYLTYRDLVSDDGLPDAIFDDNGGATLTLVIGYSASALQGRMTNFINAFLTVDQTPQQGVQVSVIGKSSTADNALVTASDSLETLSAVYGVGVGPIAEVNKDVALSGDVGLPVVGVIHLITESDAHDPQPPNNPRTPEQILDALAAYYSAGMDPPPISRDDIADLNPGVTAAVGVSLFIPEITYKVGKSAGGTLASIAHYFGVSLDQLAVSAAEAPGLFAASSVSIDSLTYDLSNPSGAGNISFEIRREAYPEPVTDPPPGTPAEQDTYARDTMYALYGVISAGLQANVSFSANNVSLPFGPQNHDTDTDADAMRDPDQRRKTLQKMGTADEQVYRQTLNIARNAKTNASPTPPYAPPGGTLTNPYIGVGSLAQLALEWRDVFGNTTVTPWRKASDTYEGAQNGQPLPVLYADRLIGLAAWPNLQAFYSYAANGTTPDLTISMSLSTGSYEPSSTTKTTVSGLPDWQQRAQNDLATYTTIWWQLSQDYSNLNLPWCDGPAVTATLRNSLTGSVGTELKHDEQPWLDLVGFVKAAIDYLAKRAQGQDTDPPATVVITQPVDYAELSTDNVIPLSLGLTFTRPSLLVEPSVASLVNGHTVTSPILPQPDATGTQGQSGYADFAQRFEEAFVSGGAWKMRVGAGLAQPDETINGRSQTLWAVRLRDMANDQAPGITYQIDDQPGFYAPKPLARTLSSGQVKVKTKFDPTNSEEPLGGEQTVTLTGVDANALFETCLKAVDGFLSPTYATPAFLLQANGDNDPLTSGPLGDILSDKQTLADAIAATVCPVLSTSPGDDSTLAAAREKLRQALLNQLAPAYAISAVVAFGVVDFSGAPMGPAGPATLYGQPMGTNKPKGEKTYSMSTARISLGTEHAGDPPQTIDPRLAFLFDSKNAAAQSYVGLPLEFPITHMEHDRTHVAGINGYTQSSWIAFITGPIDQPLAGGKTINIPVVLRALPEPPTMQGQSASATHASPTTPGELAQWDFGFDYLYRRASQDTALMSVGFNREVDRMTPKSTVDGNLLRALVEFTTLYPQIETVFEGTLAKLSVADATDQNSENAKLAETAVKAFAEILGTLTTAFDNWARPKKVAAMAMAEDAKPQVVCDFELVLSGDPKSSDPVKKTPAHSEILNLTLNNLPASYDEATHTVTATDPTSGQTYTLPAPWIEISGYTAAPATPYSSHALFAYSYSDNSKPPKPLDYGTARRIADRQVVFKSLNLFVYQDAWAAISIERNKYLIPAEIDGGDVATHSEFMFATPVVRFADPAIPELSFASLPMSGLTPVGEGTAGYLNAFFADATAGGLGAPIEVAMEGRYSYLLADNPNLPRTVLPVAYLPPTGGTASGAGAPAPVIDLAGFIDAWRAEYDVTRSGAPRISLALKIFNGGGATRQPILSLADLYLDATLVPPKKPD